MPGLAQRLAGRAVHGLAARLALQHGAGEAAGVPAAAEAGQVVLGADVARRGHAAVRQLEGGGGTGRRWASVLLVQQNFF